MLTPRSFTIFGNPEAQKLKDEGRSAVISAFEETFGNKLEGVYMMEAAPLKEEFRRWALGRNGHPSAALAAGGDGTFMMLAGAAMDINQNHGGNIVMGHIPLGTQCVDAEAFGFPTDYRAALPHFLDAEADDVDVGNVNGHNFLIGATMDLNTVNFFEARESLRKMDLVSATLSATELLARFALQPPVRLKVTNNIEETTPYTGKVFAVSNNLFMPKEVPDDMLTLDKLLDAENLKRVFSRISAKQSLNCGRMGFYAWDGDPRIISTIPTGTWPHHWSVSYETAKSFSVMPADPAEAAKEWQVTLDGEVRTVGFPMEFKNQHKALKVLRPK